MFVARSNAEFLYSAAKTPRIREIGTAIAAVTIARNMVFANPRRDLSGNRNPARTPFPFQQMMRNSACAKLLPRSPVTAPPSHWK